MASAGNKQYMICMYVGDNILERVQLISQLSNNDFFDFICFIGNYGQHIDFSLLRAAYNTSILEGPDFVFYKQSLVNKESNLQRGVFTPFSTFPHCFIGYLLLFMGLYEDIMYARY